MDKRIKKTRRLLSQTFVDLLKVRDFDAVTIRDITERADVAYSTFFRNFDSKEALLLHYLRDFLDDLAVKLTALRPMTFAEQLRYIAGEVFHAVAQCPDIYRILYSSPQSQSVLKVFKSELLQSNDAFNGRSVSGHTPPVELVVDNVINQLFGMVAWWIDRQLQPDCEQMTAYFDQIAIRPLTAYWP